LEHARQVIIPIIVLHDLTDEELESWPVDQQIDLVALQMLADSLMDTSQVALIEVSDTKRLHSHPHILAALHKSQVSSAELVMMDAEGLQGFGLQKTRHTHIDSESLLTALLSSLSDLSDESFAYADLDSDIEEERELSQHARHHGSRVFPVFLLQLSGSSIGSSHLTTEDRNVLAANHDGAFVLQMVGSRGKGGQPTPFFSGHAIEGHSLFVNSSHITSNIAAALLTGLAGVVPPQEQRANGIKTQDWRWALGASPFGPYSHSLEVSGVFLAAARRNLFISHMESALSAITRRLTRLDSLYLSGCPGGRKQTSASLSDPFAFLFDQPSSQSTRYFQAGLLDEMLASHLIKSNESEALLGDSSTADLINNMLKEIEESLEEITYALYTLAYGPARDIMVRLLALVDRFVKVVDKKLDTAEDLAACCGLHFQSHHPREGQKAAYIIMGLSLLLVISMFSITCCARKRSSHPSLSWQRPDSTSFSNKTSAHSPSKAPERSGSILSWLGEKPEDLPTFSKSSNSSSRLQRMFSNH
jgi:hypothetical protein